MERIDAHQGKKFIRSWLAKLCSKGITTLNLEHDPGLRGMMAVTRHLEGRTNKLPHNDGERQIYRMFFQPVTGERYEKMHWFLSRSRLVTSKFNIGEGRTFDFSGYGEFKKLSVLKNVPPGMPELVDELVEVFVQAYKGKSSPGK